MRAAGVCELVLALGAFALSQGTVGCSADAPPAGSGVAFGSVTAIEGELRHALVPGFHRPQGSTITWATNPPSSGDHCESWGQWATYPTSNPLLRCNYVHNLEHGGVVLLYNCPAGCPDTVKALERLIGQAPADPDCGTAKRIILTSDPMLDSVIAASAWGFTWKADTWSDAAADALAKFMAAHLGSRGLSPEPDICAGGSVRP